MAAAEPAVPALPGGGAGAGAPSGTVPVLFCFSVFARPSAVPHGAGYELLIQKFLSLYGDQIDMHRKFVVQLFAEEWGQYVDLPKGFAVSERCKVRLVPLQIQVGPAGGPRAPPLLPVSVCPRPRRAPQVPRGGGPVRLAGRKGPRRCRKPGGRPREGASPKVTVTSCPRPTMGRGPPGEWLRARTPPRVWSSAARIRFVCRERVPASCLTEGLCSSSCLYFGVMQNRGKETVGSIGLRVFSGVVFTTCGNTNFRSHILFPPPLLQLSAFGRKPFLSFSEITICSASS